MIQKTSSSTMIRDLTVGPVSSQLLRFAFPLFLSNALLGALNLLPVYPLDLWRALHAVLESRLTPERLDAVMQSVSLCFLAVFAAACAVFQCYIGRNVSLLAVLGYLLIMNLKRRTMDV